MTTRSRPRSAPATRVTPTSTSDVRLRPLERGDSAAVLTVFAGMSPRSRALRFLTPKPQLTRADLQRLTAVDEHDHVAVVAASARDLRPIGIARFVRDTLLPDSAEVAVAVVDAWQNRGVGTMLLGALSRRAVQLGVTRLTAVVSSDNVAVDRLLHRWPGCVRRVRADRGAQEWAVSLEGGLW
jgi:RimJ/RimL family protein N-acetyltransferase